jgi:hypothetical protein
MVQAQKISGSIIAEADSTPIAFANIAADGTNWGTVSNQEGEFEINFSHFEEEIVVTISVIGFKTKKVNFSNIEKSNPIYMVLTKNVVELKEIEIKYVSEEDILNKFFKNYSANYHQESIQSKAFYHSTFSENGEFKLLLEATIVVQEFTKRQKRSFEVEITQRRKSNDYRVERWAEKNNYLYDALGSNPMLELSDFLSLKNQKNYNLEGLPNTTYNNETVYVIEFITKRNIKKPLYNAKVYIKANDFELIKAEYNFYNTEGKIGNQSLKDKTYHIPFINGAIEYQKIGYKYVQKFLTYTTGIDVINNVTNDTLVKDVLYNEILFLETEQQINELKNPLNKCGDIYKKPFGYNASYWNQQVKIPLTKVFVSAINDLEKHQNIEIQYFNNSAKSTFNSTFENSPNGKIDSILSIYHLTNQFNGVAMVTSKGKTVLHKAYGFIDMEKRIPLDTASIFDIGSITKQFTTAILALI